MQHKQIKMVHIAVEEENIMQRVTATAARQPFIMFFNLILFIKYPYIRLHIRYHILKRNSIP